MTDSNQLATLSPAMRSCIERFSDQGWRERKFATEELVRLVTHEQPDGATMEALIDVLLDLVLEPASVSARAAGQEALVALGRTTVPRILSRLDRADPRSRLLVDLLGSVGTERDVRVLAEIALDPELDENMRASAATALGSLGGSEAIGALENLLDDTTEMLTLYALDGLRSANAVVDVGKLIPHLDKPISRRAAVGLLGSSGSVDAISKLVPLLGDKMAGVRAAAAQSLFSLHRHFSESGRSHLVASVLADVSVEIRERVRALVEHRDRGVCCAAIALAAMSADAEIVPLLFGRMEDPIVYEQAVALIARLGPAANEALVKAISEVESGSREQLFRLIAAIQAEVVDPRLMEVLMAGLTDPSDTIASAAADALKKVGGRSVMAALYRACSHEGAVGEHAADALAEIALRVGGRRHDELTLLIGGSWPQEGALAQNLCRVVGKLGLAEYVPPLVSMLGSHDVGVRVAAAHALGHVPGEHEGVSALSFSLADEEPQVRAAACRSLGMVRAPRSVQPLLSATNDPSPLVRAAAVQALVAIDNPISFARLREIVLDDPSPTVVVHAIGGLGASRQDQDLTLLMSLCSAKDHEVVKAAARSLRSFSAHRATAALLGLLDHERWDVRWAAAEVLAARGDVTALGPLRTALENEQDGLVRQVVEQAVSRLEDLTGAETSR